MTPRPADEPTSELAGHQPPESAHLFIDYWNIVIPARKAARRQGRKGLNWDRFPGWLVEEARIKLGLAELSYDPPHLFFSYNPRTSRGESEDAFVNRYLRAERHFRVHRFKQRPIRRPATCPDPACRAKAAFCPRCGTEFEGNEEKGVDVALALTLAEGAWRQLYDVAILVSGDSDLIRAVRNAKRYGRKVVVAAAPSEASGRLLEAAHEVIEIDLDATPELLF